MEICKTIPAVKDYIWGGTLFRSWGKRASFPNIAECWELSFRDESPTLLEDGTELRKAAKPEDIGEKALKFPFFPTLIKLINSAQNLSVQVHPSDEYALKSEGEYGKTEMWHIIEAEPGAGLYIGFKKDTDEQEVRRRIEDGTIIDILNFVEVHPGGNFFIPSGTVHAIGKGVTLVEIQQNSNLTYRLYDYKRLGKDGKPRELHIDKAMKVLCFKKYKPVVFPKPLIGECPYFSSSVYPVEEKSVGAPKDCFASMTFLSGEGTFSGIPFKQGDTFFIPAGKTGKLEGNGEYVYTTLP